LGELGVASAVIELRNVSMHFGDNKVLNKINLQIHSGEIFVLIGPSGQGKSVLLKVMAGLLPPTSGELLINGENFFTVDAVKRDLMRRKMGMLFQKNALFDSLTAAENVSFPLIEAGQDIVKAADLDLQVQVTHYLEAVGLSHAADRYPDEISGGMQKRLGIARAIALKPEIIFYDDPTAGLDPITSRKIVDLILRISREQRSTAVAVTNDMNRAYQMASRIGMVVGGELIVAGTPTETRAHKDPRVSRFIRGQAALGQAATV